MRDTPVVLRCKKCLDTWKSTTHVEAKCTCGSDFEVVAVYSISGLIERCEKFKLPEDSK